MSQTTDTGAVAAAEQQLAAAHLAMDITIFEQLLHPDYTIVQPGGHIETKADVLTSYRTGIRHWTVADVSELDVRLYGDTAVVIGRWRGKGTNGDAQFDYCACFSSVWLRNSTGRWQNLTYQSAELEEE